MIIVFDTAHCWEQLCLCHQKAAASRTTDDRRYWDSMAQRWRQRYHVALRTMKQ